MQSIRSGAGLRSTPLALVVICLTLFAQQNVASAQATAGTAIPLNVSGSLASACASQAGILSLFQNVVVPAGQGPTSIATSLGLGSLTFPDYLVNAAGIEQLAQITWEYIYSFPLPVMAKVLAGETANATAANTFYASKGYLATPNQVNISDPTHDYIYKNAFLDLTQGPQVITVPTFDSGRYYVVAFLDLYTNTYTTIGTSSNSTAGSYLVVGRGAPANATYIDFASDHIIHAPTDVSWVQVRVRVFNNIDIDTAAADALLGKVTLSPYNASGSAPNAVPKAGAISSSVNGSGYGLSDTRDNYLKILALIPSRWFNVSAAIVNTDPPGSGLGPLDTALTSLGAPASDPLQAMTFEFAYSVAEHCITTPQQGFMTSTFWYFLNVPGNYGDDYLQRAQIAYSGVGVLPYSEEFAFGANSDSQNRSLTCVKGNYYTIDFTLPIPVNAFWSLTLYSYNNNEVLVTNAIDRYSIDDQTSGLVLSGSNNSILSVFIAAKQPTANSAQAANWLPAPGNDSFVLELRLFAPQSQVLAGQYIPPAILRNGMDT